ncbi:MAG: hypothetical protein H5T64_07175 [Chloroflexi bacterium]|nr:hypothetical protein [Chloroflexota bacterium]
MSNLIVKAILGLAFWILCLALILFVSAGSLGFWQAWVFLAVFSVCTILITAYLIQYDPISLPKHRIRRHPGLE